MPEASKGQVGPSPGAVYGLLPKHHPILGRFIHAPCARNATSRYSESQLISITEYEKTKKLRNNPFTGQFHNAPRSYSFLHSSQLAKINVKFKKDSGNSSSTGGVSNSTSASTLEDLSETVSEMTLDSESSEEEKERLRVNVDDNVVVANVEVAIPPRKWYKGFRRSSDSNSSAALNGKYDELISKSVSWVYQGSQLHQRRRSSSVEAPAKGMFIDEPFAPLEDPAERALAISDDSANSLASPVKLRGIGIRRKFATAPVEPDESRAISKGHSNNPAEEVTAPPEKEKRIDASDSLFEKWVVKPLEQVSKKYEYDPKDPSSKLGSGTYSCVIVAEHRESGRKVGLKIIKKKYLCNREEKEMVKREVEIHQRLKHRNIVSLLETYESKTNLYLVLQLANYGTLEDFMYTKKRVKEAEACVLMSQVFDAVVYLHQNGVLHADIKPANILLHISTVHAKRHILDVTVKLCDFGLSRKVPDVKFFKVTGDVYKAPYTNFRGTIGYIAPEILRKEAYTISADIWSLGIILFEQVTGTKPFMPYTECLTRKVSFPEEDPPSSNCMDLIGRLLIRDASKRLEIKHARNHPWFSSTSMSLDIILDEGKSD